MSSVNFDIDDSLKPLFKKNFKDIKLSKIKCVMNDEKMIDGNYLRLTPS